MSLSDAFSKREDLRKWGGHPQQFGGTRLVELADGIERGSRAIEFRNAEGLEFDVHVDRGMDIGAARYRGKSLVWHSQAGFPAPAFREHQNLGWMRTFGGGLLATCGLDHIYADEQDPEDTYEYPTRGAFGGMAYDLHGRVGTVPGLLRGYGEEWTDDGCRLFAEGEVRQAGAFAESLTLRRTVSTTLTGRTIEWEDAISNEGAYSAPHMLLYHINFGAPLLGPGSKLALPSRELRWTTPNVEGREQERVNLFSAPDPKGVEEVFEHDLAPGADGRTEVALINEDGPEPWGISMTFDREHFSHFLEWKVLAEGSYALALEPTTNAPGTRAMAREAGEMRMIEPGQTIRVRTAITVLDGAEECERASERVAGLLGNG